MIPPFCMPGGLSHIFSSRLGAVRCLLVVRLLAHYGFWQESKLCMRW
jgi:hypothetical protein